eukprot:1584861-Rhodomonas_salina.5
MMIDLPVGSGSGGLCRKQWRGSSGCCCSATSTTTTSSSTTLLGTFMPACKGVLIDLNPNRPNTGPSTPDRRHPGIASILLWGKLWIKTVTCHGEATTMYRDVQK